MPGTYLLPEERPQTPSPASPTKGLRGSRTCGHHKSQRITPFLGALTLHFNLPPPCLAPPTSWQQLSQERWGSVLPSAGDVDELARQSTGDGVYQWTEQGNAATLLCAAWWAQNQTAAGLLATIESFGRDLQKSPSPKRLQQAGTSSTISGCT